MARFLSKNESLPIKDDEFIKKNIPETLTFDLHGYSLDEANNKVKDIILKSYETGIKKLVLILAKEFILKMKKILMFQKI